MFIFERLLSRDLDNVYYIIHNEKKGIFNFYTQDEETRNKIILSDNWERTFYEIYINLFKTVREECKDDLLEWKIPAYSPCVKLNCERMAAERKRREQEGLQTRIKLKK